MNLPLFIDVFIFIITELNRHPDRNLCAKVPVWCELFHLGFKIACCRTDSHRVVFEPSRLKLLFVCLKLPVVSLKWNIWPDVRWRIADSDQLWRVTFAGLLIFRCLPRLLFAQGFFYHAVAFSHRYWKINMVCDVRIRLWYGIKLLWQRQPTSDNKKRVSVNLKLAQGYPQQCLFGCFSIVLKMFRARQATHVTNKHSVLVDFERDQ